MAYGEDRDLRTPQVVVVGRGDHFNSILAPTLQTMMQAKLVRVVATVDIKDYLGSRFVGTPHLVRDPPGQELPELLATFRNDDLIVLLAHDHSWHCADALALVKAGFRVIVEKPYGLNHTEIDELRTEAKRYPRRLAFAEYYLMMKAAPLLHACGLIHPAAFFLTDPGHLEAVGGHTLDGKADWMSRVGRLRFVVVDVLEGEGSTGRLDHRGKQFADVRDGIGVILDLGIHAIAPLLALRSWIGGLGPDSPMQVQTAVCDEFVSFAEETYGVAPHLVPETYAELTYKTYSGVRVFVRLGKYVLQETNQRRVILVGDRGVALLDLSSVTLSIGVGDQCPAPVLASPKRTESKYVAVIRSCFEELRGASPFAFDVVGVCLQANELAITGFGLSRAAGRTRRRYSKGEDPGQAFGEEPLAGLPAKQ